jgi:non-specific serine/threonine protein kinase
MGIVLLGEDPVLQRPVAIKTLPHALAESPDSYERFEREARLLAALNHPNVATIHSLEVIDGAPILTMEQITGETLATRLRRGALSVDETLRVGTKIARAIEAAHERGVIHRDLKPGNVMLREDGEVKVLDFGLAKSLPATMRAETGPEVPVPKPLRAGPAVPAAPFDSSATAETVRAGSGPDTSFSGTLGYMSPEQIRGEPIDERTDLFALGCVLFECATGTRAFAGETTSEVAQATLGDPPPWDRLPEVLPSLFRTTLAQCLVKDPAARPPSAAAVCKACEESLERARFAQLAESWHPAAAGSEESPGNLPHVLTKFIGRDLERRQVADLLASHSLVTLTGAGGAGKTRLAIEVARTFEGNQRWGRWLIELAPLTHAGLLEKTVMTAIGIPERTDRSARDSICDHFGAEPVVLVLDSCEHLLEASAAFAQGLLQRCRGVRILVTSREPLGLPGEHRYVVPPLSSQELAGNRPAEALRGSEAVTLFMERARQVRPQFELTPGNLEAVVGICRRLDGLPLAIELAASRVKVLEPEALLSRLDDRFRILTGGSREKLPHQRTLLASIEWSHDQLSAEEKMLFRRLGIFAGGFTLEAAEVVCVDRDLEPWLILDGLGSLIDKSMIEPALRRGEVAEAVPRYRMLETFRQYANEQAAASGEEAAIRERFVRYWSDAVRAAARQYQGPEAKTVLFRLDAELGNTREAVQFALQAEDPQQALALTGNLVGYWMRRAHWSEGREFLRRALERPGAEARTPARATALNAAGTLEYLTGRYPAAIEHLKEAIDIFGALGMKQELGRARTNLGNTYCFYAKFEEGLREHEAVLAIAREIGHEWLVAAALVNICNVSEAMNKLDRIEEAAREAVVLMERVGDRPNLLMAKNYVGVAAYRQARYEEAAAIFSEGLAIAVEYEDRYNIGHQRLHRGLSLMALGRRDEAYADYRVALETAHEFDEPNLLTSTVEAYAHAAHQDGNFPAAAKLLGFADRLRAELSVPPRASGALEVAALREILIVALGREACARLEHEGRAITIEAMIERARALVAG